MGSFTNELRSRNLEIFRSQARREARQGVLIAFGAIVAATLGVCFYEQGQITLAGVISAQYDNPALWVLNFTAFVFPLWGQYASRNFMQHADAMVHYETEELR
ncbi:MAG: GGDEF-domain containing protein, partial [Methylococcaceae bacterium]|nr:GGDEF-domain containing protein [Methylococcaceae bacterium]